MARGGMAGKAGAEALRAGLGKCHGGGAMGRRWQRGWDGMADWLDDGLDCAWLSRSAGLTWLGGGR